MVPPTPTLIRRAAVLLVAVVLAVTGAIGYAIAANRGDLPDTAALKVDGKVVSVDTVASRMKALQALYGIAAAKTDAERDAFQRDTAKSLAVEEMLEGAAREKDIAIADKSVDDTLAALIAERYPDGGRGAFVHALSDLGASEEQVKDEIRQQMLVAQLFDNVTGGVAVSDTEVTDAFAQRRDALGTPEQRRIRNIVVETRADANKVVRALDAGADFAAAAKRSSLDSATRTKGGLLGIVRADQLETGYATVAFAARAGKAFGPVKTQYGWNVGVVDRVVAPVPATFAAVEATLKATLEKEKSLSVWGDWLRVLVKDADVTYAKPYRPSDPDSIPALSGAEPTS